jgi:hypothetical protein
VDTLSSPNGESVSGALRDQVALELREDREHPGHGATARSAHVECLLDDDERPAADLRALDDRGEVEKGTRETIESRDDQDTRLPPIEP